MKGVRGLPIKEALRKELETFARLCARPDTMGLVTAARDAYEAGGDSHDAFGLPGSADGGTS